MTVESGLRAFLLAIAEIDALVTAPTGVQIWLGALPQKGTQLDTYAAVVLVNVSNPGGVHLRGPNATTTTREQIDCWARTADRADRLGKLVRQRLNGYQGTWSDTESPANTISVQAIIKTNEGRIPEVEVHGGLYRHTADYFITWQASDERVLI